MTGTRRAGLALMVVLVPFAAACASTRGGETGGSRSDRLSREEIMGVQGARSLYDVVQRLRPRWLTARAEERSFGMTTGIVVYQDQSSLGDVEQLKQLGPSTAYEIRYLDGTTASATLPGLGSGQHVAGAIVIITREPRT
jgi:hypothetical protein